MAIDPVPENFYRFQFREFLQKKADSDSAQPVPDPDILFADILQNEKLTSQILPAPQDLGEIKRAFVPAQALPFADANAAEVRGVEPKDDRWRADSAGKYSIMMQFGIPEPIREQMEIDVRSLKKRGNPCPHRDANGFCSALFIRCGERRQFAIKETREQKNLAHRCKYVPQTPGKYVLIADDDKTIRDFCKTVLEIFSGYSEEKIVAVESFEKALEALYRFKQENGICGLAFVDSDLPCNTGYELVNELYRRNFNVEVIMMSGQKQNATKPAGFLGDLEIIPHRAIVINTITKPFHSEELVEMLPPPFLNRPA